MLLMHFQAGLHVLHAHQQYHLRLGVPEMGIYQPELNRSPTALCTGCIGRYLFELSTKQKKKVYVGKI